MNRRDAIKQTALIMGFAVSASAASAVLAGCEVEQGVSWKPAFLTPKQASSVAEIAERIIPKTTTPGAKDVLVDRFIDVMLEKYLKKAEVSQFMTGLAEVDSKSMAAHNKAFVDLSDDEKDGILKTMAGEASEMIKNRKPSGNAAPPAKPFFTAVKELSILGYFSSEEVGKNVLAYDPIPGGYQNCIPLEQNGGVNWSG